MVKLHLWKKFLMNQFLSVGHQENAHQGDSNMR